MLVPLSWLKEYINIKETPKEFGEMMTMSGTMVEDIKYLGEGIEGVVVARIEDVKKHPEADKLVICDMYDGKENYQVVTGAPNFKKGDIVPFAKVGAKLPGGIKLKKAKLRGVESFGMLCSAQELGMSSSVVPKDSEDGIYIFDDEVKLGIDAKDALGLNDYLYDFELTNNRPDCNSVMGIAAEAGATVGERFTIPENMINDAGSDIDKYLSIEVKKPELCKRYCARMLKVKKVEPSPLWMQRKLMACGIRPISNIVDVSNYVMLEFGQPLHMFDYDKVDGGKIIVDTAVKGDKVITLDNIERVLDEDMLMIKDKSRDIAVAGVMGAANTVIDENTKNIIIESAAFDKTAIRKTARTFGLRSESSAHFEKGINPVISRIAVDRAASLLIEMDACELIEGVIDVNNSIQKEVKMNVNADKVNALLGTEIDVKKQASYLELLGFEVKIDGDTIKTTAPKFREDINCKEDIYEDIARIYGYENIPKTLMEGSSFISEQNTYYAQKGMIRSAMVGIGAFEILTYTFTSKENLDELGYDSDDIRSKYVKVLNPLGEDTGYMRTSMVVSMLEALSVNYNRKNEAKTLFEVANVYFDDKYVEEYLPYQTENLMIGKFNTDYFEIKGIIEYLFEKFKIEQPKFIKANEPTLHPSKSAYIMAGDTKIGYIGNAHPRLTKKYNLEEDVVIAEIYVKEFLSLYTGEVIYKATPKYPALERDIAVVVDADIYAGQIEDVIKSAGGKYLISCEVFDVFEGEQVGEGKKSIAFSLKFRADDRTLTDEEIDVIFDKIVTALKEELDAKLR